MAEVMANEGEKNLKKDSPEELIQKGICPECRSKLIYQSGCKYCRCGYEACG